MKKFFALAVSVMMICILSVSAFAANGPFDTRDDAAAEAGLNQLLDNVLQDSIYGSTGNANEECYNLFDDDFTTKFCTGTFPLYAAWQMDKAYCLNGIIFATANDNSQYLGRNPDTWTLYGSTDDENWEVIAEGTADDFEDVDFMYYYVTFENDKLYEYYMWEVPNVASGCFQVSELIPCGTDAAPAAETPAVEETPSVEETPAEATEETAPAETPAEPVAETTAPETFDTVTVIAFSAVIALSAIIVLKKKAVR